MAPTPFNALIVPSALYVTPDMLANGFAKCVVLMTLKHSARNCSVWLLCVLKVRNRLISRLGALGPRNEPRPAFPNRASVTGLNADTSKYWHVAHFPPRICTGPSLILSANCVLVPGAFRAL